MSAKVMPNIWNSLAFLHFARKVRPIGHFNTLDTYFYEDTWAQGELMLYVRRISEQSYAIQAIEGSFVETCRFVSHSRVEKAADKLNSFMTRNRA